MYESSGKKTRQLVRCFPEAGDRACFDALYDLYADRTYRRCLSYLRDTDEAADAAQEIWVKVYLALPRFRHQSSFSTWLFRIVSNHCVNMLRKRRVFVSLDTLREEGYEPVDPENVTATKEIHSQVTQALSCVSKDMKALLLMKYVDEYSYEEIAAITGLGVSAVKMRVVRAKEHIRATLSH